MATGNPKTKWLTQSDPALSCVQLPTGVSLSYEGKAPKHEVLATPAGSASPLWTTHPHAPNRLYYGDNLPLLAALLHDSSVKGHVKLIYIDPPFATNSVFHSRTQTDAYQDLLVGAAFLEFMRKRLILLRELLSEDGSVYVHLDENMAFHIKVILDEIFGVQNFRNWITRRKCSHKNYTKKTYGNISDYILFYTKSDTYVWNRPVEAWTTERSLKEYTNVEEGTGRRYKKVPVHAPGTRNGETGLPWRGVPPPPGKHWQYTPKMLDEMDARGEIYWSPTGNPRRKIYLDKSEGVPIQDIWYDFRDTRNQNVHITGYPTEKNPHLLERIIQASSNPGDLVLDCFSGSGTTLAVADVLGRQWIGIDKSREAISTTLRRFTKGTERMGNFVSRTDSDVRSDVSPPKRQLARFADQNGSVAEMHDRRIKNFTLYGSEDAGESLNVWRDFLES
ncbi:MAG: site-specific DNA-methyltransferase [Chloroflexales bacterium]